jgi:DNA repair protein RecN (Recombination protein N)
MLKKLNIENIVHIDNVSIDLNEGLNVFTGETGAGKSILLEGLGLALGSRANFSLIGNLDNKAETSAEFLIPDNHPIKKIFIQEKIEFNQKLVLKRVISNNGISKAYLNNNHINLNILNKIGQLLVEVQGQFDNHTLLDTKNHVYFLDQYGQYNAARQKVTSTYLEMKEAKDNYLKFKKDFENFEKTVEFTKSILIELDGLGPKQNEEGELLNKRALVANSKKLIETLNHAGENLNGEKAIKKLLNYTLTSLEKINIKKPEALEETIETLKRAYNEIEEASIQINNILNSIETSPDALDGIDNRLYSLRNFARKVQCDTDKLFEYHIKLKEKINNIDNKNEYLENKEKHYTIKQKEFKNNCLELRRLRIKASMELDQKINKELPSLKLDQAKFKTSIKEKDEGDWNEKGSDEIIFNIITNPNQNFMPLDKIVSGGELSRFLLAIKVVLAGSNLSKSLVFDEVDSGIGGQTANAVGERLFKLSQSNQVIVITHSPQVAAKGETHFLIEKYIEEEQPNTLCNQIASNKRVEEISRMLSGESITEEARAAAMKLLYD